MHFISLHSVSANCIKRLVVCSFSSIVKSEYILLHGYIETNYMCLYIPISTSVPAISPVGFLRNHLSYKNHLRRQESFTEAS